MIVGAVNAYGSQLLDDRLHVNIRGFETNNPILTLKDMKAEEMNAARAAKLQAGKVPPKDWQTLFTQFDKVGRYQPKKYVIPGYSKNNRTQSGFELMNDEEQSAFEKELEEQ
jgi:hypothetical protein